MHIFYFLCLCTAWFLYTCNVLESTMLNHAIRSCTPYAHCIYTKTISIFHWLLRRIEDANHKPKRPLMHIVSFYGMMTMIVICDCHRIECKFIWWKVVIASLLHAKLTDEFVNLEIVNQKAFFNISFACLLICVYSHFLLMKLWMYVHNA